MKDKPQITDEEIHGFMDFEGLIKKHRAVHLLKNGKVISLIALGIAAATVFYFVKTSTPSSKGVTTQNEIQLLPDNSDSKNKNPMQDSIKEAPKESEKELTKKESVILMVEPKPQIESAPTQQAKDVFIEAEPIDGFPKLYNFLNRNLKYPEANLKDKIEGVEIISFVIDEKGSLSDPKVIQSLGKAFDEEAMRLIKMMPQWKPATLNDRPVPSKLSLPFTFTINK